MHNRTGDYFYFYSHNHVIAYFKSRDTKFCFEKSY